jgi:hypothetical protein
MILTYLIPTIKLINTDSWLPLFHGQKAMKLKLDYFAMSFGILGSLMVSMPHDWQRGIGFILFLSANFMWLKFCYGKTEWRAVMYLNIFYMLTSLIGIWNNIF